MLDMVIDATSERFARALVMPNLTPPVRCGRDILTYRARILAASRRSDFLPLMTFKILPSVTREDVTECFEAGAVAGKLYPVGVTTNSDDGVSDLEDLSLVFEAMQELGLILCVHGEEPGSFVLNREWDYLPRMAWLNSMFPRLRIVLEHITTSSAAMWIEQSGPMTAATITPHHLWTTLDDVIGGSLDPHAFCKPVPKGPGDREALRKAVMSGNPKFFLGTDSAPHAVDDKERCGCAGVFCAPTALESVAQLFDDMGELGKLEAFTSEFGADFYGIPRNEGFLELVQDPWVVPHRWTRLTDTFRDLVPELVPFMAGKRLRWRIVS